MRASISADSGRGPGYGIIEFYEVDAPAEPTFTMQRASDSKYLGPGGWQESEMPLAPSAWDNDGGSLRLAVGPAVVDEVDNLGAYRITLSGRGSCTLAVKNIVYSNITGGQGMSVGEQTAFINRLKSRLARYEEYDRDRANWESFGQTNPGDWMYRVPLSMLP